jgi:hypothetical protein
MEAENPTYYWQGPLAPYPAKVDLVAWLVMSSEERRQLLKQDCEADLIYAAADVVRVTDRCTRYWDFWAALLDMDAQQRAGEVRRDIEAACADMRPLSAKERAEEVERQVARWAPFWDQVAAAAAERRGRAGGAK